MKCCQSTSSYISRIIWCSKSNTDQSSIPLHPYAPQTIHDFLLGLYYHSCYPFVYLRWWSLRSHDPLTIHEPPWFQRSRREWYSRSICHTRPGCCLFQWRWETLELVATQMDDKASSLLMWTIWLAHCGRIVTNLWWLVRRRLQQLNIISTLTPISKNILELWDDEHPEWSGDLNVQCRGRSYLHELIFANFVKHCFLCKYNLKSSWTYCLFSDPESSQQSSLFIYLRGPSIHTNLKRHPYFAHVLWIAISSSRWCLVSRFTDLGPTFDSYCHITKLIQADTIHWQWMQYEPGRRHHHNRLQDLQSSSFKCWQKLR